jgi:hypothetical protein
LHFGKEDFAKLGRIGVPIIIVADTKYVEFDEGELKSVLKSKVLWQLKRNAPSRGATEENI